MYFCVVLCIVCFVSLSVLFVCICVLNNCHRLSTQLQLNISYPINVVIWQDLLKRARNFRGGRDLHWLRVHLLLDRSLFVRQVLSTSHFKSLPQICSNSVSDTQKLNTATYLRRMSLLYGEMSFSLPIVIVTIIIIIGDSCGD